MKKEYRIILILLGIAMLIGLGLLLDQRSPQALAGTSNKAIDIVGSRSGTTTVGAYFSTSFGTSTYPTVIGADIDTAIYSFYVTAASTTMAAVNISILASNDADCAVLATSTTDLRYLYTRPLTGDIHWVDATNNIVNIVGSRTALSTATSSILWTTNAATGTGRQIILTELAHRCLALQINATSTALWVQLNTKQK
jgi:hypothetical protein